jgi:norsolorinic acid ketoreductase
MADTSPGLVKTDMGQAAADDVGMEIDALGAITPLESVTSLLAIIDKATKESHGGKFWNYDGEQMAY